MRSTKVTTSVSAALLAFSLLGCSASLTGKALNVGVAVGAGLDFHSSGQAIARGTGHEGHPIGDSAVRRAVLKAVGASAVWGFSGWIELKGKPVVAHAARAMVIAAYSVVSWHNYQIARR